MSIQTPQDKFKLVFMDFKDNDDKKGDSFF